MQHLQREAKEGSLILNFVVQAAIEAFNLQGDQGGVYFEVSENCEGHAVFMQAGISPKGRIPRRTRNAAAKVDCIYENDFTASFQGRDVEKGIYGGGIRYKPLGIICAFSGFEDERIDEAVCLVFCTAKKATQENVHDVIQEAKNAICPNNTKVEPLLDKFLELAKAA